MIWRHMLKHLKVMAKGRSPMLWGLAAMSITSVTAQAQTLLEAGARYPRVRLLQSGELIATVLKNPGDWSVKVFSSTNNGTSFTHVGTVTDPDFVKHTSSPDFIALPNGNLILALNVDTTECTTDCYSKIKVYRSTDNGRNWSYISTAATASNHNGFWEPNFSIASDGALVMTYADETSSCCDQKLMRIRSYDGGVTWQDRSNLIALAYNFTLRPGMPMVVKLTDGTNRFMMSYEVCGQSGGDQCRSYYKTSTDGWNYGADNVIGTVMQHADGRYWQATPVIKALPGGPLLWMGKHFRTSAGSATGNGTVISKSASGNPNGPWTTIAAPVTLSNPTTSGCQGFSPGLQWVNAGSTIVHLQMRPNAGGSCDVWFGTGPS